MRKLKNFIFTTNSAIWFEKNLNEKIPEFKPDISIKINKDSLDETIKWLKKQKNKWVVHPKEITTALKNNHIWPYVKNNNEIIGCIKIGYNNVYITDFDKIVKFPKKKAFIYDTYVLEEKRKKGLAKYLISQACNILKKHGYTQVRCHIPKWNKASIRAYEQNGFKKIRYVRFFRILGISFKIAKSTKESSAYKIGKVIKENKLYD